MASRIMTCLRCDVFSGAIEVGCGIAVWRLGAAGLGQTLRCPDAQVIIDAPTPTQAASG
jgi:hypothetical protein